MPFQASKKAEFKALTKDKSHGNPTKKHADSRSCQEFLIGGLKEKRENFILKTWQRSWIQKAGGKDHGTRAFCLPGLYGFELEPSGRLEIADLRGVELHFIGGEADTL